MISYIRLMLEYGTYPIWLYGEDGCILDNDNPPEWNDDVELTNAFIDLSKLYCTYFIDTQKEFSYIGAPNQDSINQLEKLAKKAVNILYKKNNGKYKIVNEIFEEINSIKILEN